MRTAIFKHPADDKNKSDGRAPRAPRTPRMPRMPRAVPGWLVVFAVFAIAAAAAAGIECLHDRADRFREKQLELARVKELAQTARRLEEQIAAGRTSRAGRAGRAGRAQSSETRRQMEMTQGHAERALERIARLDRADPLQRRLDRAFQAYKTQHTDRDFDNLLVALGYAQRVYGDQGSAADQSAHRGIVVLLMAAAGVIAFLFVRFEKARSTATRLSVHQQALHASEQRFRALVRNASDIIAVVDAGASLQYISPAVERLWGYAAEALLSGSAFTLIHPDDRPQARLLFDQALGTYGANLSTHLRSRHADGSWRRCAVVINNLLHEPGVEGVVVTYHDVTERDTFAEQLAHQSFHDALTGLSNRVLFLQRLEQALARARQTEAGEGGEDSEAAPREVREIVVACVDLDNFKIINDSLGHETGDRLLVEVAGRIGDCVRSSDVLARISGDTFAIVFEGLAPDRSGDTDDVLAIMARIHEALRAPIPLGARDVFVTASIGIARSGVSGHEADGMLRDADTAMYQAKMSGKDTCTVFEPSMNTRAVERLEMETDLRRALDRNEFQIHYQPILKLETGALSGVEALVRWEHPRLGLVPPAKFLPIAEETGLIVPIGRWVMEEACRQARAWQDTHPGEPPLVTSVNLSARQLQYPGLVEDVAALLEGTGLDPACLSLEITESVMMLDADETVAVLTRLRERGVRLAVDDFGTGYSSIECLSRFPLDTLKIDRAFISRLTQRGRNGDAIVQAIISLAQSLNLSVTSEGIETEEQLAHLRRLGCDGGQGYYFARPQASLPAMAWTPDAAPATPRATTRASLPRAA